MHGLVRARQKFDGDSRGGVHFRPFENGVPCYNSDPEMARLADPEMARLKLTFTWKLRQNAT